MADPHPFNQMIQRTNTARGDDRDRDGIGDGPGQLEIEAGLGAVAVHGGEQDLTRPQRHHLPRIGNRVEAGRVSAAMREDFPPRRLAGLRHPLGVDGDDDALGAELVGAFGHKLRGDARPPC